MLIVNVRDCSADSCNSEEFLREENFQFLARKHEIWYTPYLYFLLYSNFKQFLIKKAFLLIEQNMSIWKTNICFEFYASCILNER